MKQPRCICCHPDARECYRRRYGVDPDDDEDRDQECDCGCHDEDEDGFSEWDDED